MELLERDGYLTELETKFKGLSEGNGCVVLISGEAGIGKTCLIENFTKKIEAQANILWGACDALFTPRPLGPLYDIAAQLKNGLLNLLEGKAERTIIFTRFLQDLQQSELPNILIMEDVHWADESTLDLIKFLGRRSNRINSLLIITYRDDEINSEHPLRLVLGDIPSQNLIKFKLPLLSEKTVNNLAASRGLENLYNKTGGNPFLITELVNNQNEGVPSTIKDSILTRVSRLSNDAKELVQLTSIVPTRTEKWLIDKIITLNTEILEECLHSGLLKLDTESISFKHELSRMAVEESLSEPKRQLLNEKVLQILLIQNNIDNYLARIIHHASGAGNKEIILKYAPLAAQQASKFGAHILAAKHYLTALEYSSKWKIKEYLDLLKGRSYECYLTGQIEEALEAGEKINGLLISYPDPALEGENYRRMSRMLWYDCNDEKADEYLNKAIDILENLPPGKNLVMAYSCKSQMHMIREETELAVQWGKKAVKFAREINDLDIEAHALNNIGTAKMFVDDPAGENHLKRSLELSLKNNFTEHASRAYTNIGCVFLQRRRLNEANEYFKEGTEYFNEKDLYVYGLCMTGHHAHLKLYLGQWDEAVEMLNVIFRRENIPAANKIVPLFVVGLVRARRGDPGAENLLGESYELALTIREPDKIVVTLAAKAEAYWLNNKLSDLVEELETQYAKILKTNNPWTIGVLAYWLWKAGRLNKVPDKIAKPYYLQIKGDWKSATKLWEELQSPYEQAMALSEGDEEAMKKAIEIFESLSASASALFIKQKMRKRGLKKIPKGPRKTTRENLAGLTSRQMEVLKLLSKGLSNNEIGSKLFISPKTVDHHISAIFSKLNIHSRFEAAAYLQNTEMIKK